MRAFLRDGAIDEAVRIPKTVVQRVPRFNRDTRQNEYYNESFVVEQTHYKSGCLMSPEAAAELLRDGSTVGRAQPGRVVQAGRTLGGWTVQRSSAGDILSYGSDVRPTASRAVANRFVRIRSGVQNVGTTWRVELLPKVGLAFGFVMNRGNGLLRSERDNWAVVGSGPAVTVDDVSSAVLSLLREENPVRSVTLSPTSAPTLAPIGLIDLNDPCSTVEGFLQNPDRCKGRNVSGITYRDGLCILDVGCTPTDLAVWAITSGQYLVPSRLQVDPLSGSAIPNDRLDPSDPVAYEVGLKAYAQSIVAFAEQARAKYLESVPVEEYFMYHQLINLSQALREGNIADLVGIANDVAAFRGYNASALYAYAQNRSRAAGLCRSVCPTLAPTSAPIQTTNSSATQQAVIKSACRANVPIVRRSRPPRTPAPSPAPSRDSGWVQCDGDCDGSAGASCAERLECERQAWQRLGPPTYSYTYTIAVRTANSTLAAQGVREQPPGLQPVVVQVLRFALAAACSPLRDREAVLAARAAGREQTSAVCSVAVGHGLLSRVRV